MDLQKTTSRLFTQRTVVRAEDSGKRLDVYLAGWIPEISRRRARLLVAAGAVRIDGRRVRLQSRAVAAGQEVVCHLASPATPPIDTGEPLEILHEDAAILAIDKPAGMPSHPTYARTLGTALQIAEAQLRRREGRKVALWPLHRLDAATSGVLLFAKTQAAARAVNQNFARRRVEKRYRALVRGVPGETGGEIRLPLVEGHLRTEAAAGGKEAVTRYQILERFADAALLEIEPLTGRMHQIRVHLARIGHPVLGDAKYGGEADRPSAARLMLHASSVALPHPVGGRPFIVESPLPDDFRILLATLRESADTR
jgi:23S rRNA pseudouridine1911/1915/1917 synthase